jgi:hypothetical protein
MKFRFLLFLSVFIWGLVFSQTDKEQSKDIFVAQLKKEVYPYLHANVYKESKVFISNFSENNNPDIDRKVMQLHQLIQERFLSVSNDYIHFFKIYNQFYTGGLSREKLNDFMDFIRESLNQNKITETKKLVSKLSLFLESEVLFEASTFKWYVENADWELDAFPFPTIKLNSANLFCTNGSYTFKVKDVEGHYYLLQDKIVGVKGEVLMPQNRKVLLGSFDVSLSQMYFEAKNSILQSEEISNKDIPGTFTHRMYLASEEAQNLEPQFVSTEIVPIKKNTPNIKISSGVHIRGNLIDLMAPAGKSSRITFFKDGRKFVQLDAHKYSLEEDRFYGKEVMFTLFLHEDSIMHPSIDIDYHFSDQTMQAKRNISALGQSPFYDGLHEIQIVADYLNWKGKEDKLIFMNKSTSILFPVVYQSLRFFDVNWYIELFDFTDKHPTSYLYILSRENDWEREFYLTELVDAYKMEEDVVEKLMIDFTNQGFVNYNPFEKKISIQDRFFRFVTAMDKGRDYDKIRWKSLVNNRPSGEIDLNTGDLQVFDVKEVHVSLHKQVSLHPSDRELTVHPGMNFTFNGLTSAGPVGLFGDEQYFNYDQYRMEFTDIDSFRYLIESKLSETDTSTLIRPCKTVIQEISGNLQIDYANNKSAKKEHKKFPLLSVKDEAYVYYDQVKEGIYDKERFYFKTEPFEIDSLLLTDTKQLTFEGDLVTTTIFPDIHDEIELLPSDELGFNRETKETYTLYDQSEYFSNLYLRNSGLSGGGDITFGDAFVKADSIDFYPDYLYGEVQSLVNNSSGISSPEIEAKNLRLDWYREEGIKEFKTQKEPFSINESSSLIGGLEFYDDSVGAYGVWQDENIILRSDSMLLTREKMSAQKANFKIFDEESNNFLENEIVLKSEDLAVSYDYYKDQFYNDNINESKRYISDYLHYDFVYPMMTYERDNSEIYFEQNEADTANLLHITESKNPYTDNIKYVSPTTHINMKNLEVRLIDLEGVNIADAIIKPKEAELLLHPSGLPNVMVGARINLIDKKGRIKHSFQNCTVTIQDSDHYLASAEYEYVNRGGESQIITFDSLFVAQTKKTTGIAQVNQSEPLLLDPYMPYHGNVHLDSVSSKIFWDGDIQFRDPCSFNQPDFWVSYADSLTDAPISIKKTKAEPFSASFVFYPNTKTFGIEYFHSEEVSTGKSLSHVKGNLTYSDSLGYYHYKGNHDYEMARFKTEDCVYELESFLDLSDQPGIDEFSYGRFFYEKEQPDSVVFQAHIGLDFKLPPKAMRYMVRDFKKLTKNFETTYESSELFDVFLHRLVGEKGAKKYYRAKSRRKNGLPKELRKLFFINDIDWQWNKEKGMFETFGPIELNAVAGKRVDRILDGYMAFAPREGYNRWIFYFKLDESDFYYFEIIQNEIYTSSSNERYNQIFKGKKKENVNTKKGKMLVKFRYPKDDFLKLMDK